LEVNVDKHLGNPFFDRPDFKSYKLDARNFHKLNPEGNDRKMAFVDGGNQEIIHAPNFSLQVNRVYFNLFKGGQRLYPQSGIPIKMEFLSLTTSEFNEDKGEIYYETSIFPVLDEFYEYLPYERDLSFSSGVRASYYGTERYDMERIASIARRFAEWSLSKHIIDQEMDYNDILVRDGSLQISFANEDLYSEDALVGAKRGGVIFTGLSKTSHLLTDTGLSLIGAIQKLAEESKIKYGSWCYYPVADVWAPEYKAVIMVVKLNPIAQRIFRFEIRGEQAQELKKEGILDVLSSIAENSRDVTFPGYPYGLIDADLQARIREDEVDIYETRLLSEISRKSGMLQKILPDIRAADGHDILNQIAGE
jgi:NurA domain